MRALHRHVHRTGGQAGMASDEGRDFIKNFCPLGGHVGSFGSVCGQACGPAGHWGDESGKTEMSVLLIQASPSAQSRSAALLNAVQQQLLQERVGHVEQLRIASLPAQALLLANGEDAQLRQALAAVQRAQVVVIATPVYKAAYSGLLKVFLDLLPQTGLKGKTVLPLATGGSPNHMLALDYALRPVLQSLSARHILPGVYGVEGQIVLTPEGAYTLEAQLQARLHDAVTNLLQEHARISRVVGQDGGFEAIPFAHVRCSV